MTIALVLACAGLAASQSAAKQAKPICVGAADCEAKCEKKKLAAACTLAARDYRAGRGVTLDKKRARALNERGCKLGDQDSCVALAHVVQWKDPAKATKLLEKACKAKHADACVTLASRLMSAEGVKQDWKRGKQMLEKACNGGNADACLHLGTNLLYPFRSSRDASAVEKLVVEALGWLEKGCALSNAYACSHVAHLLGRADQHFPSGAIKPDPAKASAAADKACDLSTDGQICWSMVSHPFWSVGYDGEPRRAVQQRVTQFGPRAIAKARAACAATPPDGRACSLMADLLDEPGMRAHLQAGENGAPATIASYRKLACDAGEQYACLRLHKEDAKQLGAVLDRTCDLDGPLDRCVIFLGSENARAARPTLLGNVVAELDSRCKLGFVSACDTLARAYGLEMSGLERDLGKSKAYYRAACALVTEPFACEPEPPATP